MTEAENLASIRLQAEGDPISMGLLDLYDQCSGTSQRTLFLALANLRNKGAGEVFAQVILATMEKLATELRAAGKLHISPEKES